VSHRLPDQWTASLRVTALTQIQVERAISAFDGGCPLPVTAERYGVTRKTLSRAVKLFKEAGPSIFEVEKLPQKAKRYPDKPKSKPVVTLTKVDLLYVQWV